MIKVLITVEGGVIQSVTSTEEIQYLVVDFDNIQAGDDIPTMDKFVHEDFIRDDETMERYLLEL